MSRYDTKGIFGTVSPATAGGYPDECVALVDSPRNTTNPITFGSLGENGATVLGTFLGKRLAVGEVTIRSPGEAKAYAHATPTYAIPPGK